MGLQTQHFARCIQTLESALELLAGEEEGSVRYEVFRNAVVKGFELSLETAGNLIRKALQSYGASARIADGYSFKELFRQAARHDLLDLEAVERWFTYRDNRNDTAHDYGVQFAEQTLELLPHFVQDARALEATLKEKLGNADA